MIGDARAERGYPSCGTVREAGRGVIMTRLLWGVLAGILAVSPARAVELPKDPILRMETGMHTSQIRSVSTDRKSRLLLTASLDKTARLWSLPDGKLLRVFRPPIADGKHGNLGAAALSPDGKLVVVAGPTGWNQENSRTIYKFDAASGEMLGRVGDFNEVISQLQFSPDGKRLLARIDGFGGIHVWRTGDWSLISEIRNYPYENQNMSMGNNGFLFVLNGKGKISLYDRDMKFIRGKILSQEGMGRVSYSSEANKIAISYSGSGKIDIVDASNLKYLYTANNSENESDPHSQISWSGDGNNLFSGNGMVVDGKCCAIRWWGRQGKGENRKILVPGNGIWSLTEYGASGVAFGTAQPAWGVVVDVEKPIVLKDTVNSDMRAQENTFSVNHDGTWVRFGLRPGGGEPYHFDLSTRSLAAATSLPPGLSLAKRLGLDVTGLHSFDPKLAGVSLFKPSETEMARSFAIAPMEDRFVLGTGNSTVMFSKAGEILWKNHTTTAWAVNISGDGRLVVTAAGDGTVTWRRASDGRTLLTLFVHAGDKRWVAWTPKGYYMASPKGEELIGWHVNNGPDREADFFGAGRFRDTFNRPDVVERVLTTLDEVEALRQADAAANRRSQEADVRRSLPPVIDILSPAPNAGFGSQTVTVRYRLRSPSGLPVTRVRVLIDGQAPSEVARGLARVEGDGSLFTATVSLPARDVTVGLVAETEQGAGEVVSVPLTWTGGSVADLTKPRLYALAVGVSNYDNPDDRLGYAAKDAGDFARALEKQKGGLYRDVVVKLLPDATKNDVLDGLEWLEREVGARDVGVLFLSGHGLNDQQGEYWFVPRDGDRNRLRRSAINQAEIKGALKRLAGKTLLFLDTCHAGQVAGTLLKGAADTAGFVNDLASAENGIVVYASSTGRELSMETASWQNGAFTKALVQGLGEFKADSNGDGVVSLAELDLFLTDTVKTLTQGRQHPVMVKADAIRDYPIGMGHR